MIRKIKDRARARWSLQLAEVGGQDTWQRAEIGIAVVSGEAKMAGELVVEVVRGLEQMAMNGEFEMVSVDRGSIRFGDFGFEAASDQASGGWRGE